MITNLKVWVWLILFGFITCKGGDDPGPVPKPKQAPVLPAVPNALDIFLEDVGNTNTGADLEVLFTEPEDISEIKEYKITVFTYQQYAQQPTAWKGTVHFITLNTEETLGSRSICLPGDMNDVNGAAMIKDQQYRVVISSIPKDKNKYRAVGAVSRVILLIDTRITRPGNCQGYQDWASSPYVLPYPVGKSYRILQGNCSPWPPGHHISKGGGIGYSIYTYDISMPLGSEVSAMRAGTVAWAVDGNEDFEGLPGNSIWIDHGDGTFGFYAHLGKGLQVSEGESIEQGQIIAKSGASGGLIEGWEHMHVGIHSCLNVVQCVSQPLTFSNTIANENGLEFGVIYPALE